MPPSTVRWHDPVSAWVQVSFVPYAYPTEKSYIGWLDCADLAALLLEKGLRAKGDGVLGLLRSLTLDTARSSLAAVNKSNNDPFWTMPSERSLTQVRVCVRARVRRECVLECCVCVCKCVCVQVCTSVRVCMSASAACQCANVLVHAKRLVS